MEAVVKRISSLASHCRTPASGRRESNRTFPAASPGRIAVARPASPNVPGKHSMLVAHLLTLRIHIILVTIHRTRIRCLACFFTLLPQSSWSGEVACGCVCGCE